MKVEINELKLYVKIILTIGLLLTFVRLSKAQVLKQIGLNTHYGFIFAHSKDVENTRGSYPLGIALEYSKLKFDSSTYSLCRCYPRTGLSLMYFNYDNKVLGHSISSIYFLEPSFIINKKLLFTPRGGVGLSFLTHPYHPIHNPLNNSYSLPVSVLLQVGAGLHYKINQKLTLNLYANYLHISNGGIKDPNKGINWPTTSLGINYQLNHTVFKKQNFSSKKISTKFNRVEVGIYSSSKIVAVGDKQRYFVPGVFLGYFKQLNHLHSLGIVVDYHRDYSLQEKQKRNAKTLDFDFASAAIGHEFLMGKFRFWQQVGIYATKPQEWAFNWYHRWGLKYAITKNLNMGVSIKAHNQIAHFADLRLSYNFYKK